ncbi:MAG TPA: hypothetical protein VHV74_01535 [Pseudonocardiaceae bacterium]|nr:hypothetical protein [Pseudonocardiaceae bacterium]
MRTKGITFDTGFISAGISTREHFDTGVVRREIGIIRDDLHCTAVRVTGGDRERLRIASAMVAEAGMAVWVSPFTCDLTTGELLDFLADCAVWAEELRAGGADVVFLTGSEIAMFTIGFLPGDTIAERLALLADPPRMRAAVAAVPSLVDDFLTKAVAVVRERFGGPVGYASIPFERVDWTPFDIVATDGGYRSAEVAHVYADGMKALVAQGKPVAITEFGCATYRGSADQGARGDHILRWRDGMPYALTGEPVRDEAEQATCIAELFGILDEAGVDAAFVCTLARYDLPHRDDPARDLDMASNGIVKIIDGGSGTAYPGLPWEPKAAFETVARLYGQ